MYYVIKQTLQETTLEDIKKSDEQYVAVLSFDEWKRSNTIFDMGIELDIDELDLFTTKAEVNYDSLTGAFVMLFQIEKTFLEQIVNLRLRWMKKESSLLIILVLPNH